MPSLHSAGFQKVSGKRIWPAGTREKGGGECLGGFRMHPAYINSISTKIKHLCKSGSQIYGIQSRMFAAKSQPKVCFCLSYIFFFSQTHQFTWSKVLKGPNAARPNEENCNNV